VDKNSDYYYYFIVLGTYLQLHTTMYECTHVQRLHNTALLAWLGGDPLWRVITTEAGESNTEAMNMTLASNTNITQLLLLLYYTCTKV